MQGSINAEKTCCVCQGLVSFPIGMFVFCKYYCSMSYCNCILGSLRNHSTSIHPSMQTKKARKKRVKSTKKYAELLVGKYHFLIARICNAKTTLIVVSDNSTIQQKTAVKKLNPNDLKIFTTTNFDLSELYKLKSFSYNTSLVEEHTYNNLTVIENIPQLEISEEKDILTTNLNSSTVLPKVQEECDEDVINCEHFSVITEPEEESCGSVMQARG